MFRLSLRNVLAHKVRFALTTLAVVVGVGFVVGSFVVTDSLRGSVGQLFDEVTRGVDVAVRATSATKGSVMEGTAVRGRVDSALVGDLRRVKGVAAAEGQVGGYAQLLDRDGKPVTTTGAPFLGVSWGHVPALMPATITAGRTPKGMNEVAIDQGTAEDYRLGVGDTTTVLLASGRNPIVHIVGVFRFGTANNLLGARLTAFDLDVAPTIFGTSGQFDSIAVVAAPGVDSNTLAKRINAMLPARTEAVTGAALARENKNAVAGLMGTFQNILLGFAGVALFVSAFFINNTFSIIVGQRTRELALLRSIAATPGQVLRSVLGESVIIGSVASVVGTGFGLVIASALRVILRGIGFGLPQRALSLAPRTLLAAVAVGLGVTVVSAFTPARRAARVPPVLGMQEGFRPPRTATPRRIAAAGALTASGVAAVAFGLFVAEGTQPVLSSIVLGAFAVFIGVAQLSPLVAVPLVAAIVRPLAPRFRMAGRLAHKNAIRNPERTAKTASALMIGLALVTTVFVVGTSIKRTFSESIDDAVAADYVVSTNGMVGFSPAITDTLKRLPELSDVTAVRFGHFLFDGKGRDLLAVDPVPAEKVVDIQLLSGSFARLDDNAIFLHKDPARDHRLAVGDYVDVTMPKSGDRRLRVAGIYGDSTYAGNYLVSLDLFKKEFVTSDLDALAFARRAPGVTPAAASAAVKAALKNSPQVKLDDRASFKASQQEQFDAMLAAVNGLLGLALFIALLGIGNTLALSVLERTREIGLLRAVGMVRGQTRLMVLDESAMVAVFGAALGVVVGLFFGAAVTMALPASVARSVAIPYTTIAVIVLIAAVCGLIAGLIPARRASRLDVLAAVAAQ